MSLLLFQKMQTMKTSVKIGAFMILMIVVPLLSIQKVSAQNENISLQVFYDELGQYGTWVDNPQYGSVWVPNVESGFRPYVTNGHWVFTDYGWTWSSDYPWGWAAFHYGRWYWDAQYGNVWVPDTVWGPAWVSWRQSEGYYGWAPLGPGMGIGNGYGNYYNIPTDRWCFVRDRDLMRYDICNYFVDRLRYSALIGISRLLFTHHYDSRYNYAYVYGPERGDFQRCYGRLINPIRIYDHDRPGQYIRGDRFSLYRPQFGRGGNSYNHSRMSNFSRNDYNRGGMNSPQSYRSDYSQRENNMSRSAANYSTNRSGNIGSVNNSMAYQNSREQSRMTASNENYNRSANQMAMNEGRVGIIIVLIIRCKLRMITE